MIASGSHDKSIFIWDASTGRPLLQLARCDSHKLSNVYSVAYSPDGRKIAAGSEDHIIRVWDVMMRKQVLQLDGHTDTVDYVAFSPDGGNKIVSGGYDQSIRLWDASTGKQLLQLECHNISVRSVALSPDGSKIASLHLGCIDGQTAVAA